MSVSVPDTMESICKYHRAQQLKITHLFHYPSSHSDNIWTYTREQLINRIIFCELLHVPMNVSIYCFVCSFFPRLISCVCVSHIALSCCFLFSSFISSLPLPSSQLTFILLWYIPFLCAAFSLCQLLSFTKAPLSRCAAAWLWWHTKCGYSVCCVLLYFCMLAPHQDQKNTTNLCPLSLRYLESFKYINFTTHI